MAISMLKIRRPLGRLIFNMGIAIPGKTVFLIETAPGLFPVVNIWFIYVWGKNLVIFFDYGFNFYTHLVYLKKWALKSWDVPNLLPVKVTLDISRSPIESQWGSRKYPG